MQRMYLCIMSPSAWVSMCASSLPRSTAQTVKRQTENLRVDYYVTRDFRSEFKGNKLHNIEKNVEEDYVSNVRNNCWKERQTSKYPWPTTRRSRGLFLCPPETDLLYAAKVYRDDRMRKKAELMTMDNCRELDRLNDLFRGGWAGDDPF